MWHAKSDNNYVTNVRVPSVIWTCLDSSRFEKVNKPLQIVSLQGHIRCHNICETETCQSKFCPILASFPKISLNV